MLDAPGNKKKTKKIKQQKKTTKKQTTTEWYLKKCIQHSSVSLINCLDEYENKCSDSKDKQTTLVIKPHICADTQK